MKGIRIVLRSFVVAGFVTVVGLIGFWEASYNRTAVCTGFVDNVYIFTDLGGHTWEWETEEEDNFQLGDEYILKMDDNHSSQIKDDIIIKVEKK